MRPRRDSPLPVGGKDFVEADFVARGDWNYVMQLSLADLKADSACVTAR